MGSVYLHRSMKRMAVVLLCGITAAAFLSLGAGGGCDANGPGGGDGGSDNSDLPDNLKDPEATGEAIFRDIERALSREGEGTDIVDGLPASEGPEGALFGVLMDDGKQLYLTGTVDDDNEPVITGAVMEDVSGQLILKQEVEFEDPETTITVATGDSMRLYPESFGDAMFVELSLAATDPPTTLVFILESDGEARLIEGASSFSATPSDSYTGEKMSLPRAGKSIPMMRSQDFDPTVLRDAVASKDCPIIEFVAAGIDDGCSVWAGVNAVSGPARNFNQVCATANVFLDTVRDGDPSDLFNIPGLSTDPLAVETIAKMKIGLTLLCFFGDFVISASDVIASGEGWSKLRFKAVDFFCGAQTIINERSRIVRGGGTVADRICRGLSGDILVPGCINTCEFARDGTCDDGGPDSETSFCPVGTDCADCGPRDESDYENEPGCNNTCAFNFDGICDDSAPDAATGNCDFGTDCADCGRRDIDEPPPSCEDDGICNEECSIDDRDPDCDGDDFCRIHDICCDGDGICDLVRCPDRNDDSDCTNLEFCDRLDMCCPDDGVCDVDCPTDDEDCGPGCDADGECATNCSTPDPDCVVNAPTSAVCPGGVVIDIGFISPFLVDLTLDRFEGPDGEDDYSATCVYKNPDGGDGEWPLVMTYIPPYVSDFPSGACGSEEPGDRVFNSGVLESTVRYVEVVEVFTQSSRLVDREDKLGELLDSLIGAEIGAPCD